MEDHRLRAYCLVVETKSFSRAAQAKHMTQSAMSRLIKNLEDEMGVMLLYRKGKVVVPTSEGRLFYEHAKKILEEYSMLEHDVCTAAHAARGALRLGASRTPAVHLLPQVIYDFSKAYPEIRIELSVCKTSSVLLDLREGKMDVGIVEGTIIDQSLPAVVIAEDEVVIIASENHHLTKKKNVTFQDLTAEPFILPERGSGTRDLIEAFFRDAGVDPRHIKVRMSLGSTGLVVQMVEAGLGLAFASKWSVFTAVKEGTVKLLRLPGRKIIRHFYFVDAKREVVSPTVKLFSDFIKGHRFFIPF